MKISFEPRYHEIPYNMGLNDIERIVDSKTNSNYYNLNHITIDHPHFWFFYDFYTIFEKFHDFLTLLSVEYSSKLVKYN